MIGDSGISFVIFVIFCEMVRALATSPIVLFGYVGQVAACRAVGLAEADTSAPLRGRSDPAVKFISLPSSLCGLRDLPVRFVLSLVVDMPLCVVSRVSSASLPSIQTSYSRG